MSGNSRSHRTSCRRVRSKWDIFDALPLPIRAALQEGPATWDVVVLAARYRRWRRAFNEAEAITLTIEVIEV